MGQVGDMEHTDGLISGTSTGHGAHCWAHKWDEYGAWTTAGLFCGMSGGRRARCWAHRVRVGV